MQLQVSWMHLHIIVTFLLSGPERYDSLEDFFENDDVNFDIDFDDAHEAAGA